MGGGLPEVWWWWCVGLWTTDVRLAEVLPDWSSSLVAHCTLKLGEFNDYQKSVEVAPVTLLLKGLADVCHRNFKVFDDYVHSSST
jgi:hypothetical protein